MDNFNWKANEDAILRAQHPLYDAACQEDEQRHNSDYDPDGGYWGYEEDEWVEYDDMEEDYA